MIKAGTQVREKSKYLRISNCMIYNVCVCLKQRQHWQNPGGGGVCRTVLRPVGGGVRGVRTNPLGTSNMTKSQI